MNAEEIASRFKKEKSSIKLHALILEIDRRCSEINAAIENITPSVGRHRVPAVDAATAEGPAAAAELESERDALVAELLYLRDLADVVSDVHQAAILAEKKAAIPGAKKAFPSKLEAVRRAMEALDSAIVSCNETVIAMGSYIEVGEAHPLSDNALAELIQMRNNLWTPRNLAVMFPDRRGIDEPDDTGAYPKSFELMYITDSTRGAKMVRQRRPTDQVPQ